MGAEQKVSLMREVGRSRGALGGRGGQVPSPNFQKENGELRFWKRIKKFVGWEENENISKLA